jgi:hypothetical protein
MERKPEKALGGIMGTAICCSLEGGFDETLFRTAMEESGVRVGRITQQENRINIPVAPPVCVDSITVRLVHDDGSKDR